MIIRCAVEADCGQINTIYNWYIEHTNVTFDVELWSLEQRVEWFAQFNEPESVYSLVVADGADGISGFALNGRFRPKVAYNSSTVVTIYTAPQSKVKVLGSQLYSTLFDRIAETSLHRAYAIIALPNDASIRLHQKFGFTHIGTLDQVGTKFEQRIDVAWYQKKLETVE